MLPEVWIHPSIRRGRWGSRGVLGAQRLGTCLGVVADHHLPSPLQRISLRQNLLSSLSFVPLPLPEPLVRGNPLSLSTPSEPPAPDEVDEDSHDDEDAKKKEEDFEYYEHHQTQVEKRADSLWPLQGLAELEELDLYDNRIKSIKGLEGLVSLKCVLSSMLLSQ